MKSPSKTVVFFGSGPVAAQSLELLSQHFDVEAVITKPKPAHHKGDFPVLVTAEKLKLPVKTVSTKAELDTLLRTTRLQSNVAILIDFGIIVSQQAINYFDYGIINSHFSLLPRWRGADPISFSVLMGDEKTGVSLMLVDKGMDTGMLIGQKTLHLGPTITTPQLTSQLIELSDKMLAEYVPRYLSGEIKPRRQPHPDRATYSRKLTKEDGNINWVKPAVEIEREIRAFLGWPGSRAHLFGKDVIITQAYAVPSVGPDDKPGDVTVVSQAGLFSVATAKGSLWVEKLKPTGKREMTAKEFLAGYGQKTN